MANNANRRRPVCENPRRLGELLPLSQGIRSESSRPIELRTRVHKTETRDPHHCPTIHLSISRYISSLIYILHLYMYTRTY